MSRKRRSKKNSPYKKGDILVYAKDYKFYVNDLGRPAYRHQYVFVSMSDDGKNAHIRNHYDILEWVPMDKLTLLEEIDNE